MKWNVSKLAALRQCHRKFYFAYELASFHFKHPIRRKAFELSQAKSLQMWQGSLIDHAFSEKIIGLYQKKQRPDFNQLADEIVELAKIQFKFSELQVYHEPGMTKTLAGDHFQILDIHESGVPYSEEDLLNVYATVREIILQIPNYPSPDPHKTLHEYLVASSYLQPNVDYWQYAFQDISIGPQIDLVRHKGKSVHVIDWKVSESNTSDYSKQLYLAGIVAYHNIKKDYLEKGWTPLQLEDFSLYEINLMNGLIKKHAFTKETTAAALDYVYAFRDEQQMLSGDKKWDELNIEDYETTDKKETCMFCKFKPLCVHLIKNKFKYDENEYYKLVQGQQLA